MQKTKKFLTLGWLSLASLFLANTKSNASANDITKRVNKVRLEMKKQSSRIESGELKSPALQKDVFFAQWGNWVNWNNWNNWNQWNQWVSFSNY